MAQEFRWLALFIFGLLIGLGGCDRSEQVATVDVQGEKVDVDLLEAFLRRYTKSAAVELDPVYRDRLTLSLARLQVAARNAEAAINEQTKLEIRLQELELLSRAGAEKVGVFDTPSEKELRRAYKNYVDGLASKDFRIAHILVATQAAAMDVIRRLGTGESFGAIARVSSVDDSRSLDGDLGWIRPETFPAEFLELARTLEPGQYSTSPVRSSYGWHVIKLLETRPVAAVSYEQIRAQLSANIVAERYKVFLEAFIPARGAPLSAKFSQHEGAR